MNTEEMLQFLSDLENNNSLEWMKRYNERYREAKREFIMLIQELLYSISVFDPSVAHLGAEELIYRLNKDTRFSRDKTPYNASFRAHISLAGRSPIPAGYYICVKPSASFIGGGVFANQFPKATAMVRDHIIQHTGQFESIISNGEFAANFTLQGAKLKNVPKGFDSEHPLSEYLKHKSWFIECPISDQHLIERNTAWIAQKLRLMKPFNDFLNEALQDFTMPQR